MKIRLLALTVLAIFGVAVTGVASVAVAAAFAWPKLPSLDVLTDYKPRVPLRIYTADGVLITEYGQERRTFVAIRDVPDLLKKAIISAEDDRFFEHGGVDFAGLARAAVSNVVGGGRRQGGSTITMQVARTFYLSREKTYSRKLYEILLSLKIEQNLTKEQILELYINQIYLGQRAYGFASAAQAYYGKNLKQLSLAEIAMLAGLPKAPSAYNPVVNPERAVQRQRYVLRRMLELHHIDEGAYQKALAEPLRLAAGRAQQVGLPPLHAEYVAEMARQLAVEQFKEEAYTRGISVVTTITSTDQRAAYAALRRGVLDYERRHGYRGAEAYVDVASLKVSDVAALEDLIEPYPDLDEMKAAIVLQASRSKIVAYLRGGEAVEIVGDSLRFAAPMLADNAPPQKRVRRGAIIRLAKGAKGWAVTQPPEVEGAFISLDPKTGAVRSLVGGFDFNRSKFNHVTQAWRQPGSSFKPFVYSAAVEKGYTPGSVLEDAPLSFSAGETGGQEWTPQNYDGKFEGPMTLRMALAKSKNMVAIRLLQSIGARYGQDFIVTRFGFDAAKNPPYLTLALGAGAVTPWQMVAGYSVFANGGYRIRPFVVKEMRDDTGRVLAKVDPPIAGEQAERVLDARNVYLMDQMMKGVVQHGTAARAMSLGRLDLAGKTGTTNEYVDAWFCGYQPSVVAVSWVGFDQPKRLGSGETGGTLALPIWIDYMREVLRDVPQQFMAQPPGLRAVEPSSEDSDEQPDLMYDEFVSPSGSGPQTSTPSTQSAGAAGM